MSWATVRCFPKLNLSRSLGYEGEHGRPESLHALTQTSARAARACLPPSSTPGPASAHRQSAWALGSCGCQDHAAEPEPRWF